MAPNSESRLFKPVRVGRMQLSHRTGMSPLTRFRASDDHVPTDDMVRYYEQRSAVAGTLLVTEGTFISAEDGGAANVPGIYTSDQVEAWKKVTDAVHRNGSFIYCQLWALGRAASEDVAQKEGFVVKSSSDVPLRSEGAARPRALTVDEIRGKVDNYVQAAKNAVAAGFDGVELHAANGYLIDQFIQDTCNKRSDDYGGSIENRSRFAVEVATAVVNAVGADRVGIRLSPFSQFQDMRMDDPVPQFSDLLRKLAPLGLAYVHLVESRIAGSQDSEANESLEFAYDSWPGPLLIAGGYKPESAAQLVDEQRPQRDVVVMFGRYFISTPDLPFRLREGLPLNPYNRETFYTPKSPVGYIDYPYSKEFEASRATTS